jgi:hypothetical protein
VKERWTEMERQTDGQRDRETYRQRKIRCRGRQNRKRHTQTVTESQKDRQTEK